MGSLLILVLFIGMMFLMHKNGGGCCSGGHGHSHKNKHEHDHDDNYSGHRYKDSQDNTREMYSSESLKRDPICGNYVAEDLAVKRRYNGQIYFFCSQNCANEFDNRLIQSAEKLNVELE